MRLPYNRLHFVFLLMLVTWLPARSEPPGENNPQARLDRYGDPLPEGAIARLGTARWRPAEESSVLVYSPDGSLVASAGRKGPIRLWDAGTGKLITTLWGHRSVGSLAFSPDGRKLASGGKTARLWEVATGKELRRFSVPVGYVGHVSFGSAGRTLVTAAETVRRWDLETGKQLGEFPLPQQMQALALAPNGRWLAGSDFRDFRSFKLVLFDVDTGKEIRSFSEGHQHSTWASFSPDSKILATVHEAIHLWSSDTGEFRSIGIGRFVGYCLAFSRDGKTMALQEDEGIVIRDVATGERLQVLRGHQASVWALAFAPDGNSLLSATGEMTIRHWDLRTGKEISPGDGHEGYAVSLAFSPDGKMIVSGGLDRVIRLWDCKTTKQLHAWEWSEWSKGVALALAFSDDGKMVAAGGQDAILVWDVASKRLIRRLPVPEVPGHVVYALLFSADGKTLFASGFFPNIRRWDLASGKELPPLEGHKKNGVKSLIRSPDGKLLVSAGYDGTVRVWEATAGKELQCLKGESDVHDAAFSPDGTMIASEGRNGTIQLWETATGKLIRRWKTCHSVVWSLAFSRDGKYLATAGLSRVIGLWEVATGHAFPPLLGHRGGVWQVRFSPDGKTLASTGDDTTILLWDMDRPLENPSRTVPLTTQELEVYWNDLSDPERVGQAVEVLFAGGSQSVDLIRRRLPEDLAQAGRIERLITDLNSDNFATREKASAELAELGSVAESALRRTLTKPPSPEVRRRVVALLDKLPKSRTSRAHISRGRSKKALNDLNSGIVETPRPLQALTVLEWIDSPESRQMLAELAKGQAGFVAQEAKAALERLAKRSAAKP